MDLAVIADIIEDVEADLMNTTAGDLVNNGLPLSPKPRKDSIELAGRPLAVVADDLGNHWVMNWCRDQDVMFMGSGMRFWQSALPLNIMVLRLIEEGSKDADRISNILEKTIDKKIEQLAEMPRNRPNQIQETKFAIAAAFYVLANIDRLENVGQHGNWLPRIGRNGYDEER